MLNYHHSITLENIIFGELKPDPQYSNPGFFGAYQWLEKEIGFYPLFLAVGSTEDDIRMTGYQNQWARVLGYMYNNKIREKIYRKIGESPNLVLFSYANQEGICMDYEYWHIALNAGYKDYQLNKNEKRWIFKPSWKKSDWLRKARNDPGSVQLVVPRLSLADADLIWVRNNKARLYLENLGFSDVEVKRISVDR